MTLKELSEKTGLSISYLSRLEDDNSTRSRTPTLITLEKIAIGLSVCPTDLIFYLCTNCQINNCKKRDSIDLNKLIEENLNFYI